MTESFALYTTVEVMAFGEMTFGEAGDVESAGAELGWERGRAAVSDRTRPGRLDLGACADESRHNTLNMSTRSSAHITVKSSVLSFLINVRILQSTVSILSRKKQQRYANFAFPQR